MTEKEKLKIDGITGQQFLEELFEFEYCAECGLDADAHTAIPIGLGDYGTNWFARCDHPWTPPCGDVNCDGHCQVCDDQDHEDRLLDAADARRKGE
jgi:hypothetical protein